MSYFNDLDNVEQYIQMADGYDGRALIEVLRKYVKPGSSVLELGMGPGKDLALLAETYRITGSDYSQAFIDRYLRLNPGADVLRLDAVTLEIERSFDALYSNKVLMHLTKAELRRSFIRQATVLNPGGIALHSFWLGDTEEEYGGLRFIYYTEETLKPIIGDGFEILACQRYTEMDNDDSFYVVLRRLDD